MKIKFCGMRRPEDIAVVNEPKPDFIGFILAKGFKSAIDRDDQTEQCDAEIKTLESIRRLLDIF